MNWGSGQEADRLAKPEVRSLSSDKSHHIETLSPRYHHRDCVCSPN